MGNGVEVFGCRSKEVEKMEGLLIAIDRGERGG